jgi:8-oxo-dGTP pyrophosphatase MutT (NUDIX family)
VLSASKTHRKDFILTPTKHNKTHRRNFIFPPVAKGRGLARLPLFLFFVHTKEMQLSDLITPTMPAGSALFLQWQGYHVFSIPHREVARISSGSAKAMPRTVRFFGVGGKRQNAAESFIDCALRESAEEIGAVVSQIKDATQTEFLRANGTVEPLFLSDNAVRPRLVLEKRSHSSYGSMKQSSEAYYLVAFNATLIAQPKPSSEIAALVYLNDDHLSLMKTGLRFAIADLAQLGAHIDYQSDLHLDDAIVLLPHGTAQFLIQQ